MTTDGVSNVTSRFIWTAEIQAERERAAVDLIVRITWNAYVPARERFDALRRIRDKIDELRAELVADIERGGKGQ